MAAAVLVALGAITGCGDGESEAPPTTRTPNFDWVKGPTREFIIPGGDNAVQLFGREATAAERKEASRVIHGWMRARAAADWDKDCSYMSRAYRKILVDDAAAVSKGKATTCPAALEYFGPAASGDLVNNLIGPIDSLRVEKGQAYAQYHGRGGVDWIVPMDRENGRWRVAIATPINRKR